MTQPQVRLATDVAAELRRRMRRDGSPSLSYAVDRYLRRALGLTEADVEEVKPKARNLDSDRPNATRVGQRPTSRITLPTARPGERR